MEGLTDLESPVVSAKEVGEGEQVSFEPISSDPENVKSHFVKISNSDKRGQTRYRCKKCGYELECTGRGRLIVHITGRLLPGGTTQKQAKFCKDPDVPLRDALLVFVQSDKFKSREKYRVKKVKEQALRALQALNDAKRAEAEVQTLPEAPLPEESCESVLGKRVAEVAVPPSTLEVSTEKAEVSSPEKKQDNSPSVKRVKMSDASTFTTEESFYDDEIEKDFGSNDSFDHCEVSIDRMPSVGEPIAPAPVLQPNVATPQPQQFGMSPEDFINALNMILVQQQCQILMYQALASARTPNPVNQPNDQNPQLLQQVLQALQALLTPQQALSTPMTALQAALRPPLAFPPPMMPHIIRSYENSSVAGPSTTSQALAQLQPAPPIWNPAHSMSTDSYSTMSMDSSHSIFPFNK